MRQNPSWYLPILACVSLTLAACGDANLATEPDLGGPSNTFQLKPIVVDGSDCSDPTWWRDDAGTCWPPDPDNGSDDSPPGGDPGTGDPLDGSGGEPEEQDDPEGYLDPCATDEVRNGFNTVWATSNADGHLLQRKEQGGWIIRENGQLRVETWNLPSDYCGIHGEPVPPSSGTVVGWVHTHPYAPGEMILTCEGVPYEYPGGPSGPDRSTSTALGQMVGFPGALPGYILDKGGITFFVGAEPLLDKELDRCY